MHELFPESMMRKAASVFAEVALLEKLQLEAAEQQKREKSVSILGQVSVTGPLMLHLSHESG